MSSDAALYGRFCGLIWAFNFGAIDNIPIYQLYMFYFIEVCHLQNLMALSVEE